MRIGNDVLELDGTDMSADITSVAVYLGHIINYSIQLVFTGTPGGSFKLQASNDEGNPAATPGQDQQVINWTDIDGSASVVSAAGDITWAAQNAGYRWVRLVWTPSMGSTGALTDAHFNVKGL